MLTIEIRFFAVLREHFGAGGPRHVDDGTTVGELWTAARQEHPDLDRLVVLFAVNEEYVDADYRLVAGDEVAIFPPISGGC